MFYKIYRTEAGRVQEDLFMNKESYLFDRIRWGAAIFLIFHISLLFILFLQDWKTEKMKWFILFLGVLYVILLYAAYQLIYRPLKVNSRIKAAFARGDSYEDIYHMPYLLNEEEQNMLRRFYALLDKSELITVSKKKSEYLALQNQINPHFLYNTLEGIRAEALIAGVDSIAEMTEALATYFRYTISQVNNLVSVEEELDNCETYFGIQKYRFGDRLQLHIDYDIAEYEKIMNCRIPKLTLQPILENSIIHGVELKVGGGNLYIRFQCTKDRLLIRISDDGVGMDEMTLAKLNQKLGKSTKAIHDNDEKQGGIALVNVNNRIHLIFGDEYGMHVYSVPGEGTDVEITIPILTDDRQVKNRSVLV